MTPDFPDLIEYSSEDELLAEFRDILVRPGPLTASDKQEIARLDRELMRREKRKAA